MHVDNIGKLEPNLLDEPYSHTPWRNLFAPQTKDSRFAQVRRTSIGPFRLLSLYQTASPVMLSKRSSTRPSLSSFHTITPKRIRRNPNAKHRSANPFVNSGVVVGFIFISGAIFGAGFCSWYFFDTNGVRPTVTLGQHLLRKPRKKHPKYREFIDDFPPYGGRLHQAVYSVDSRSLGRRYVAAFEAYDAYIEASKWDKEAIAFANKSAHHPAQQSLLKSSYELPDFVRFHTILERSFDPELDDYNGYEAYSRKWYEAQGLDPEGQEFAFDTADGKWHWHKSLFSYDDNSKDEEGNIGDIMSHAYYDTPGQILGDIYVSGCFWYPPGALREWHTNWNSARSTEGKMWRMYYVRQIPVEGSEKQSLYNQTAMHVLEGPGLSGAYLESIGAMPLTHFTDGTPNAWRIPDRDGQVGFFRLQMSHPFRWHTVLSDGEMTTHRFSLGLGSHTDEEVARLLEQVGIPL